MNPTGASELGRIADLVRRAYSGESWHGPAVKEALDGVNTEMAARRATPNLHSIWELTLHIAAWADIVRRRVGGEEVTVTPDLNFPPVTAISADAWRDTLSRVDRSHEAFVDFIATIPDWRLNEPVMAGGTTVYVQLHGVAHHYIYHAGQIMLLKKVFLGQ